MAWATVTSLPRRLLSLLLALAGGTLCYFGGWLVCEEILPQILASGWSLSGSHMILNRDWQGSQLYYLVALYWLVGIALLTATVRLWRHRC